MPEQSSQLHYFESLKTIRTKIDFSSSTDVTDEINILTTK
jgi:hypothetical protein